MMAAAKSTKEAKPTEKVALAPQRLKERFDNEILPLLREKLGRKNRLDLPRLEKVVINMGVGSAVSDKKHVDDAVESLTQIAGQKACVTTARKAISTFKLREGLPIGCRVTLRGRRMYEFLDRFINLVLPRVRDFRGLNSKAFDGRGNYSIGLSEQLVFPELNPDKFTRPQGMNICIVVKGAKNDEESRELMRELGIPFRVEEPKGKKK